MKTTQKLKVLMVLVALMPFFVMQAQVKIGQDAEPVKGAVLELHSDKTTGYVGGLRLANVSLDNITDLTKLSEIPTNVGDLRGAIVYNTNPGLMDGTETKGVGVFYWNGAKWIKEVGGSTSSVGDGECLWTGTIGGNIYPKSVAATTVSVGSATPANAHNASTSWTKDTPAKLSVIGGDANINELSIGKGGGQVAGNTVVGKDAILYNGNTGYNTAIGNEVLKNFNNGNNNTAIGNQAFINFNGPGNNNIALGSKAGDQLHGGNNNILIGAGAQAANDWTDNQLTLGNFIYGKDGNNLNNAKVGIGVNNPTTKLHIQASAPYTGFRLVDGNQGLGKVLISDANGNATWGNGGGGGTTSGPLRSFNPSFEEYLTTSDALEIFNTINISPLPPSASVGKPSISVLDDSYLNAKLIVGNSVLSATTEYLAGKVPEIAQFTVTGGNARFKGATSTVGDALVEGNVGVGFTIDGSKVGTLRLDSPTAKLHIVKGNAEHGFRLEDGTEGEDKVLTSDINGVGTWKTLSELGGGTSSGPWNKIGTTSPSTLNTDDSYLTAKVVVGANQAASVNGGTNNAQLTVVGADAVINGITVGVGKETVGINSNTAIGTDALRNNISDYNTAVGHSTLSTNASGRENTAIGSVALYKNLSGRENTAVGHSALHENTNGNYNTAVGAYALRMSTGEFSTAVGYRALFENTKSNNAFGAFALENNETGENNIAIGTKALQNSKTSNNIAIGNEALIGAGASGYGGMNIAIGNNTLKVINTGRWNVAVGDNAGNRAGGNGEQNVAIGMWSMGNVSSSSNNLWYNTAVGAGTLERIQGSATGTWFEGTGQGNTVLGARAGAEISTGSRNVIIGANSTTSASTPSNARQVTTGSNNITIGFNAQVYDGTQDNQISIGNLIFATGATGVLSGALSDSPHRSYEGNVGIGTRNPAAKFHIKTGGTPTVAKPGFMLQDGNQKAGRVLVTNDDGLATWQDAGDIKVTVGTANPLHSFNLLVSADVYEVLHNINISTPTARAGEPSTSVKDNSYLSAKLIVGNSITSAINDALASRVPEIAQFTVTGGNARFMGATSTVGDALVEGNVGVGFTIDGSKVGTLRLDSPTAKLHIVKGNAEHGFRLEDGTQGEGKVLTSDANGVGTWRDATPLKNEEWTLIYELDKEIGISNDVSCFGPCAGNEFTKVGDFNPSTYPEGLYAVKLTTELGAWHPYDIYIDLGGYERWTLPYTYISINRFVTSVYHVPFTAHGDENFISGNKPPLFKEYKSGDNPIPSMYNPKLKLWIKRIY